MQLSPRFKSILDAVQAHMFKSGRGGRATLLDWPDALGRVTPNNPYVVTLRKELDGVRDSPWGIDRFEPDYWFFEAALGYYRAWGSRYFEEADKPEAPWHLPYLAVIIGAWRDNAQVGAGPAVWPRIAAGLLRQPRPNFGLYQVRPSERTQLLWAELFDCVDEWSAARTEGRFLALEAGNHAYVKFIRAQKVVSREDLERVARWLLDEAACPNLSDLKRAINELPVEDSLTQLTNSHGELERELLEYVLRLVQEEVHEMRLERATPRDDEDLNQGDAARLFLQCYAWRCVDSGDFRYGYLPSDARPTIIETDFGALRVEDSRLVLEIDEEQPQELTNELLQECASSLRPYCDWSSPSRKNPIVLERRYDEWYEIPRYSQVQETEDYLVIYASDRIEMIKGATLIEQNLARRGAHQVLIQPGSGVPLGHDLYHALALPRLKAVGGNVIDIKDCVRVLQDGRLEARNAALDTKQSVQLNAEQEGEKRFVIRNPRVRLVVPNSPPVVVHPRSPGDQFLAPADEWNSALNFAPEPHHFGLLQVLAATGPRSWAWARGVQSDHFGWDDDRAHNSLYSLLRFGHLRSVSSNVDGQPRPLSVQAPALVHLPTYQGPQGKCVYWLRGGFDWWRLSTAVVGVDRLHWLCTGSDSHQMETVYVAGSDESIEAVCTATGAIMVDPIAAIKSLPDYHIDDRRYLRCLQGEKPFPLPTAAFSVHNPIESHRVIPADSFKVDWGISALFGQQPILATQQVAQSENQIQRLYLVKQVDGRVRGLHQCRGSTIPQLKRALMLEYWEQVLSRNTQCDSCPALIVSDALQLFEPNKCDWPIELCAALTALSGRLPTRIDSKHAPAFAHDFERALQEDQLPDWRGTCVAPIVDKYWRYDGCPKAVADLIAAKLGWKTRSI